MNLVWAALLTLSVLGTLPAEAHHAREYLATGSYETLHKSSVFVYVNEDYVFSEVDNQDSFNGETTPGVVIGWTDHLQTDTHFHMLDLAEDESNRGLFIESFAFDVKYRFFESGMLPVDIAVDLEYEHPTFTGRSVAGTNPQLIPRLILAKELPWGIDVDVNFGIRIELRGEDRDDEWGMAVAMKRPLTDWVTGGLEFLIPSDADGATLLPGLYFGKEHGFLVKVGLDIGLSDRADDLGVRMNLGYQF